MSSEHIKSENTKLSSPELQPNATVVETGLTTKRSRRSTPARNKTTSKHKKPYQVHQFMLPPTTLTATSSQQEITSLSNAVDNSASFPAPALPANPNPIPYISGNTIGRATKPLEEIQERRSRRETPYIQPSTYVQQSYNQVAIPSREDICQKFDELLSRHNYMIHKGTVYERTAQLVGIVSIKFGDDANRTWNRNDVSPWGLRISSPFHCEYGCDLTIEPNVQIGPNFRIVGKGRVKIASYCDIGPNVTLYTEHARTYIAFNRQPIQPGFIEIGAGTVIQGDIVIRPNTTIQAESILRCGGLVEQIR